MKGSYIFKVSVGPVLELLLSFNVLGSPSVTYPLAVPIVFSECCHPQGIKKNTLEIIRKAMTTTTKSCL